MVRVKAGKNGSCLKVLESEINIHPFERILLQIASLYPLGTADTFYISCLPRKRAEKTIITVI